MLKAKTNVIRVPSGTGKVADRNGTKSRRLEPNRPKKVPQKSHSNRRIRPGRKVGIPSASALNDIIGVDTEEESAVEKETRKCSADLEERLTEITKQEIEKRFETVATTAETMRLLSSSLQTKAIQHREYTARNSDFKTIDTTRNRKLSAITEKQT